MQPISFAVVVPMFNEEVGCEPCVHEICSELDKLPYRCCLVVVNDGSSDRTAEILEDLKCRFSKLTVLHHAANRGYGAALLTGALHAHRGGFDYVLYMDSDLTNRPRDISRFAEQMQEGHDVIKATRYSAGGRVVGVPRRRVLVSRIGNCLAGRLFRLPIHDFTNGFRAIRTPLVAQMTLHERRFASIMEELWWLGFLTRRFVEIPVTLTNRGEARRPTSFIYRPKVFWDYLKYPLRAFLGVKPRELKHSIGR